MPERQGRRPFDVHGRRRGRPLRPGRRELIENRLPDLTVEPADMSVPSRLFPRPVEDVWLEIGFGGGEHLAWQATNRPDVGFIGCEPFMNGVASLIAQVEQAGLTNVRVVPDDARPVVERLPAASIGRAFVLFPDPWPKLRHHKRRLIRPPMLDALARILRDGAELRVATDDIDYLRAILETILAHPDFVWTARGPDDWRTRPDDWPETRYERKALVQGRPATYLLFVRRGRERGAEPGKA